MASKDKKPSRNTDDFDESSVTETDTSGYVLIDVEPDGSSSANNTAAEFAQEASLEQKQGQDGSVYGQIETEIDVPEEMMHPSEEEAQPSDADAGTPAENPLQPDESCKAPEEKPETAADTAEQKEMTKEAAGDTADKEAVSEMEKSGELSEQEAALLQEKPPEQKEASLPAETAEPEKAKKGRRHFRKPQPFRLLPLHKKILRIVFIVLIVVLIAAGAAVAYGYSTIHYFYSKVNKPTVEDTTAQQDQIVSSVSVNKEVADSEEEGTLKGYINIALFGVDSRSNKLDSSTRSDSIMIASINQDTHEIKLVSVYRDTLLDISGNSDFSKCNAAYNDGAEAAVSMLNRNLDLNIHDYITIGFAGLIDAIDAVGGLEIDVQKNEIQYLNSYAQKMAAQQGRTYTPVTVSGLQTLNGLQATAYCRIRYTAGDDYKRAERQRTVLTKLFDKCKSSSVPQLYSLLEAILPDVYTSLSESEIISILPDLIDFTLDSSQGFPNENMRKSGILGQYGSVIVPTTLEANVRWLHTYLYDDYSYTPSSQVLATSDEITEIAHARGMTW